MDSKKSTQSANENRIVRVVKSKEFLEYAKQNTKKTPSTMDLKLKTSIPYEKNSVWMSQLLDRTIEDILDTGEYTPDNMLVVMNPFQLAPLTAVVIFNTEEECEVSVSTAGKNSFYYRSRPVKRHRVPVFYLRPDEANEVTVEVYKGDTVIAQNVVELMPGKLPELMKDMVKVENRQKETRSPFTFVYGGDTKYPYVFDEEGKIRYYLKRTPKPYGMFLLSQGHFIFLEKNVCAPSYANPHSVIAREMDFLGRVYREYRIPEGLHHDGCEMEPGGNILTASSSMTEYVEDAVIEIDRNTGHIVKKLCLADILSEHDYFDLFDWAHINTVSYIKEENAILICSRNLHSVFKIDWATDELLWIACDTTFWAGTPYADKVLKPKGKKMKWFYQAHASYMLPELSETGNKQMIIYDNHWCKRRPIESFDNSKKSYVRIYEIDEDNFTISLKKSFGNAKSHIRSNGIKLYDRIFSMSGYLTKPVGDYDGMIIEWDYESGEEITRYMTMNSFYRAYPFRADFDELATKAEEGPCEMLGENEFLEEGAPMNFSKTYRIPFKFIRRKKKAKRKAVRKDVRIREFKGVPPKDTKENLWEISVRIYDNILLVRGKDHMFEKVYLNGMNWSYAKDFTDTEQRSPALFANSVYSVAIPLAEVKPDTYRIYIQCEGKVYRLNKYFTIKG